MTYPPHPSPLSTLPTVQPTPRPPRSSSARRRRVSRVARVGDAVVACMLLVLLYGLALALGEHHGAAQDNAPAAASAQPKPRHVYLETLGPEGQVVARYELATEPRVLTTGVVAFEDVSGRRLFVSGLWRVVQDPIGP